MHAKVAITYQESLAKKHRMNFDKSLESLEQKLREAHRIHRDKTLTELEEIL